MMLVCTSARVVSHFHLRQEKPLLQDTDHILADIINVEENIR